jgi:N-methylhydantoinase B/oxoprolinase/acetone carboxylase alpha subunit
MVDILAPVTATLAAIKKLREVSEKLKDAKTDAVIAELIQSLAEVQTKTAELQNENTRLKDELKRVLDAEAIRAKFTLDNEAYILSESFMGRQPGSYCTHCFDANSLLVRLTENGRPAWHATRKRYQCPHCEKLFGFGCGG